MYFLLLFSALALQQVFGGVITNSNAEDIQPFQRASCDTENKLCGSQNDCCGGLECMKKDPSSVVSSQTYCIKPPRRPEPPGIGFRKPCKTSDKCRSNNCVADICGEQKLCQNSGIVCVKKNQKGCAKKGSKCNSDNTCCSASCVYEDPEEPGMCA